ncbi:motility/cell cycle regulatory protein MopJ [Phenylobacterium soli]|uniref:Histidine kinase n=1 Tax=Phenylobacterium soli TaxID=2170551 RepID=A0A328AI78_9CAUL|nr:PAS domain-containing protein [Phenylobacterium soli]RAK54470.1 histidine kinase [Phenylobacterium soli]
MAAQIGAPAAAARAHEELFAYWASRRKGAMLPGRRDLSPGDIKRLLPTVSLIDVLREPLDFRVRLAGTALYDVYGREITGRRLAEIYNSSAADYWRSELSQVAEGKPSVGVHNLAWRGASHLSILWLRLPLASNGTDVDMILGYDAVIGLGQVTTGVRAA